MKDLEQIVGVGVQATMPNKRIRQTGRKVKPAPISQGDMLNPDKIRYGNQPADQCGLFEEKEGEK